jgi:cytochrome c biogenesis protein CcmG/thiol:disulfide interchange protein DsbE
MTPRSVHLIALALTLGILAACTSGGTDAQPTGSLLPTTIDALPTMDAAAFSTLIAQQRGTPVLVNIWASWCGPCETETPDIVAAHAAWGDRVRFIGVDAQDERSGAIEFLARQHVTYPSVFDPSNAIAISFGLFSPPATLFFDAEGTLVKTVPGQISAHDLRANLRAITS